MALFGELDVEKAETVYGLSNESPFFKVKVQADP